KINQKVIEQSSFGRNSISFFTCAGGTTSKLYEVTGSKSDSNQTTTTDGFVWNLDLRGGSATPPVSYWVNQVSLGSEIDISSSGDTYYSFSNLLTAGSNEVCHTVDIRETKTPGPQAPSYFVCGGSMDVGELDSNKNYVLQNSGTSSMILAGFMHTSDAVLNGKGELLFVKNLGDNATAQNVNITNNFSSEPIQSACNDLNIKIPQASGGADFMSCAGMEANLYRDFSSSNKGFDGAILNFFLNPWVHR
ncbi:MAG: hypothetical protein CME61_06710, partial [Halobacteriovoraceae bacterium]|nr:hypothetical protein [Halobacteriovoraceae bacterium]